MRKFPERAAYVATFGSMTAAALVVIALIVLSADGDGDGSNGIPVVVAEQNIAAGTQISAEMVGVIEVPEAQLVAGAYSDTALVVGQVTKGAFAEGEQIIASRLASVVSRQGSISGGIPDGRRALSLDVEPVTTEGERILPGDHIDIKVVRDAGASTVVENVEVLAVGRESNVLPPTETSLTQATVTLAVDPEQAQLLAEALSSGAKIRLSRPA
jgi:pilus assembly protein CpaB